MYAFYIYLIIFCEIIIEEIDSVNFEITIDYKYLKIIFTNIISIYLKKKTINLPNAIFVNI